MNPGDRAMPPQKPHCNWIRYIYAATVAVVLIMWAARTARVPATQSHDGVARQGTVRTGVTKVGFAFLTRAGVNQPRLWREFLSHPLAKKHAVVKAHVKMRAAIPMDDRWLRRAVIPVLAGTEWGGFGLVNATLLLLQEMVKDPEVEKIILVSESCIPIVSFPFMLEELLRDNRSFFVYQEWPNMLLEFQQRLAGVKRVPQDSFVHHAQWFALSRRHALTILDPRFNMADSFRDAYTSDEHYFLTVLKVAGADLAAEVANRCVTFTNWREKDRGLHPKTYFELTAADTAGIAARRCLLARKFPRAPELTMKQWRALVEANEAALRGEE